MTLTKMKFKILKEDIYTTFELYNLDSEYIGRILFEKKPSIDFVYDELDFIKCSNDLNEIKNISEKAIKKYANAFHLVAFNIEEEFQNKGFGEALLKFSMTEIKKDMNNDFLYLNACSFSSMSLEKLASIYSKYGFNSYFEEERNTYMINYL